MMSKNHEVQILCAINHGMLELALDDAKACFSECWKITIGKSDTVVLYVKDIAYSESVSLPVTVESSENNSDYICWQRSGDCVRSPAFEPGTNLNLIVSAATGVTRSKKSTPVIIIKTGRPDVDDR